LVVVVVTLNTKRKRRTDKKNSFEKISERK
jgi:hypothetical protein